MSTTIDEEVTEKKPTPRQKQAARMAEAASGGVRAILTKIVLLGIVDAMAVYALFMLLAKQQWLVFGLVLVVTLVVNWIYFSPGKLPAKYLTPGLIFLIVFQIFAVGYTAYIGFTNY
ncbi:maltose ABC transporter permease, partial [Cryobacterium sp. MLB-32]